ncbi:four helix bundle protein [bacterium]|nr:four helix bundle protein [bacterium]
MSERPNPAKDKSFEFALKVIEVCRDLQENKREYILSKQLMRTGTSIGANVEEGMGSFSDKDFHYKFSIAYKEARESHYWVKLLIGSGLIKKEIGEELLEKVEELMRIIGSILKTMRNKIEK